MNMGISPKVGDVPVTSRAEMEELIVAKVRELLRDPECRVSWERNVIEGEPDRFGFATYFPGNRYLIELFTGKERISIRARVNKDADGEPIR